MNNPASRILFFFLLLLAACSGKKEDPAPAPEAELHRGTDVVTYSSYAPLASKPVKLWYYIPDEGDLRTMPILFAMHGSDRDAQNQIATWKTIAGERQVMVFAPEFTRELYPAERAYQYGGVSLQENIYSPLPAEEWTVRMIESLFDYVRRQTGSTQTTYDIWGHSAGAQFTHRLMFFLPAARVRMAVSSNAGVYLIPTVTGYGTDNTYGWPYSLRSTPYTQDDLNAFFARKLIVHIGTGDIVADQYFPSSAAAMAQGETRYARGKYFYEFARQAALDAGVPFNWEKVEVAGVPHSSRRMVQTSATGAADLLYPNSL